MMLVITCFILTKHVAEDYNKAIIYNILITYTLSMV